MSLKKLSTATSWKIDIRSVLIVALLVGFLATDAAMAGVKDQVKQGIKEATTQPSIPASAQLKAPAQP